MFVTDTNMNKKFYITTQRIRVVLARRRLAGTNFSIISNNCWGAHVYQTLGREFNTPFIGLFLSPISYLRLLTTFPQCLSLPLNFKVASDEDSINHAREAHAHQWPIGCLEDVAEIQFMHYQSEAEAREKWQRRIARLSVQPTQWFFKFCDRDGCTLGQMTAFDQLPFTNKVLFTTHQDCVARCAVHIPSDNTTVPDGLVLSKLSPKYFDSVNWLNGGSGRINCWTRALTCI